MTGYDSDNDGCVALLDPQGRVLSNNLLNTGYSFQGPVAITVDSMDRSWLTGTSTTAPNPYAFERDTITSTGFTSTTYLDINLGATVGSAMASDQSGNIYVAESVGEYVVAVDPSGQTSGEYLRADGQAFTGIALDNNRDLFAASSAQTFLSAVSLNYSGTAANSTSTANLDQPSAVAVDSAGNVWVTNLGNSTIATFNVAHVPIGNTGTSPSLTPRSAYSGGGMSFAGGSSGRVPIAMDGASSAWVPNYTGKSISAFSNSGNALSPAANGSFTGGFTTPGCQAQGVAVDGSGNVWVTCDGGPFLEFLGVATPVATPILPGQLGARP